MGQIDNKHNSNMVYDTRRKVANLFMKAKSHLKNESFIFGCSSTNCMLNRQPLPICEETDGKVYGQVCELTNRQKKVEYGQAS